MHNISPAVLVLVMVCVLVLIASGRRRVRYDAIPILTPNEAEFFRRLRRALPNAYIFPQVAMSALISPKTKGKNALADFRRISQKRVDFAIYSASLELLAIVELDDRTHDAKQDATRDAYLESAGIKTIRFQSRNKPDEDKIRQTVMPQS